MKPPGALSFEEIDTWARTNMGEARGESWEAAVGQAWTIKNRLVMDLWHDGRPDWWGEGIVGICRKPFQFSCWNANDPNLRIILAATIAQPDYQRALGIVLLVHTGDLPDPTLAATHYHDTSIPKPSWARSMVETVQIGKLVFYRGERGA